MHHPHRRVKINLGDCDAEEEILDAIEQSRKITRLIISAVQKGSKFEVSQILEHYGLAMTSRLHFKVVNIVMEQWFSLMGIEDEDQIFSILMKNRFAMEKLRQCVPKGIMVVSDLLTEWELPIGALQSKIIRRVTDHFKDNNNNNNNTNQNNSNDKNSNNTNNNKTETDQKDNSEPSEQTGTNDNEAKQN
jgi:hypothetical protein